MARTKDIPVIKFQTYYNRPVSDSPILFDPDSSLTDQDYKMMTDVNYLLEHMAGHSRTPIYGCQDPQTFEDWSNEMAVVKRRFMNLDEEQRRRFGNAQEFLKWCADPNNYSGQLKTVIYGKAEAEKIRLKEEKFEKEQIKLAEKIGKAIKE